MPPVIDAHLHVWDLQRVAYPWLTEAAGPLFRSFPMDEARSVLEPCGIESAMLVQAAHSAQDTAYMLDVAARHGNVAGIVGWLPLASPATVAAELERWQREPLLCGVRHLPYDEERDWLLGSDVLASLRLLADAGVVLDVVVAQPRQLEHVVTLAQRVEGLRIVVDHLGDPPIEQHGWQPWADLLARAAAQPTVHAKLSGLTTAADRARWTVEDLRPYVEHALGCFGPERLIYGGNWPVATQAGSYRRQWEAVEELLAGLSADERAQILGGSAIAAYGLVSA